MFEILHQRKWENKCACMNKITFLGSGLGSGGAEHQQAQLMNMLVDKGYCVTFASFSDIPDHYNVSPKVKRVWLGIGKSTKRKVLEIEKYMLTVKTDVIIAFSQRMSVLTLFPMLVRPNVKVISSERNFTIGSPDKFEKILTITGIYRRANFIVPNNYSQARYLAKKMPSIAKKIHVITNYTDVNTYIPTNFLNNNIPQVGIFCRFEQQKNFHRFIEMLGLLKQRGIHQFHVDWFGNHHFESEGQKNYFEEGLKKIQEYDVTDMISIHEPTREVEKLIPTFDVLCLPSLHEGFSNSISEYISCGRPVLCSDVSDNSVMVHENENGFLFNPLDVEDMARTFTRFLNTTVEQRRKMSKKSREIAEELFDKEKFINEYIKLIEA